VCTVVDAWILRDFGVFTDSVSPLHDKGVGGIFGPKRPGSLPPGSLFWRLQAHKRYKACGYWVKCVFTSATRHFHKLTSATKAGSIEDSKYFRFAIFDLRASA
jgi:hypothetical protein